MCLSRDPRAYFLHLAPDESQCSDHDVYDAFRRAQRTLENLVGASITLGEKEVEEIQRVLELNPVTGARYNEHGTKHVWG